MTGGCIHETTRLSTNLQEDFFLKWAQGPVSDTFAAEADGLGALRDTTDLTVPEVIGHSDAGGSPAWLLLEYVSRGSPAADYAERLGEALAVLHQGDEGPYGWHRSNYIGSLLQTNTSMDDWPSFWWSERLEPQLMLANDNGRLAGLDGSGPRSSRSSPNCSGARWRMGVLSSMVISGVETCTRAPTGGRSLLTRPCIGGTARSTWQ